MLTTLDAFWDANLILHVAAMDTATIAAEHERICALFAEAMADGLTPAGWMWRRLSALQAEHGRRSSHVSAPVHAGPYLVHYEVSASDGPGALPIRLSSPIRCF